MNPRVTELSKPPLFDIHDYSNLSDIFRSWFWRYYDHLFHLLVLNFGWFSSCAGIGWLFWRLDLIGNYHSVHFLAVCFFYLLENIVSVGWAIIIFKIFNESFFSISEIWSEFKLYIFKAIGISAVSGAVLGLAFYNLCFYINHSGRFFGYFMMGLMFWIVIAWLSAAFYQWPILFFQNPSFFKIFYRSFLLVMANGPISLGIFVFYVLSFLFFIVVPFLWLFFGMVFFFSFQCVALEKGYLKYKITYGDKELDPFLESLERERQRGWRDILRPWENR